MDVRNIRDYPFDPLGSADGVRKELEDHEASSTLESDGSISITVTNDGTKIEVDPDGLYILTTTLSELLANFRRLLVDYVDVTGQIPEGLEEEYQSALEDL